MPAASAATVKAGSLGRIALRAVGAFVPAPMRCLRTVGRITVVVRATPPSFWVAVVAVSTPSAIVSSVASAAAVIARGTVVSVASVAVAVAAAVVMVAPVVISLPFNSRRRGSRLGCPAATNKAEAG